ncbi:ATP-dependent sacrificial sulfur transferase LarE [candidate division KSB1 bacterium]
MSFEDKFETLKNILREMGGVVIGYSGGVDSTFLLKTAVEVINDNALGVIARSATYPEHEYKEAVELAREMGARIRVIQTEEDKNPKFTENPVNRCYFCKSELFSKLKIIAQEEDIPFIADGSNIDDIGDFRPGLNAVNEFSVRSPLKEAGLNKNEIRELSKRLGLKTHDKPSFACLSSRFPYGMSITPDNLSKVDRAESYLRELGFKAVRVRHYEHTARIEFGANELERVTELSFREKIVRKFKQIGYIYVTVDLEGFRSGSMNEILSENEKQINKQES